jgi:hypothetical protein
MDGMSVLSLFVLPIVSLIIAVGGLWFTGRQAVMAEERMQFEAFERRYERRWAVYVATIEVLSKVYKIITDEDIDLFGRKALEARFLFDEGMYLYLRRVHFQVGVCHSEKLKADAAPDFDSKQAFQRNVRDSFDWISAQGTEQLPDRFEKFLVPPIPARPWWYNVRTIRLGGQNLMRHCHRLIFPWR